MNSCVALQFYQISIIQNQPNAPSIYTVYLYHCVKAREMNSSQMDLLVAKGHVFCSISVNDRVNPLHHLTDHTMTVRNCSYCPSNTFPSFLNDVLVTQITVIICALRVSCF